MRQGKDVTIVAFSKMVGFSLEAAEQLAKEGIDAEVGAACALCGHMHFVENCGELRGLSITVGVCDDECCTIEMVMCWQLAKEGIVAEIGLQLLGPPVSRVCASVIQLGMFPARAQPQQLLSDSIICLVFTKSALPGTCCSVQRCN
jgi:hypothetical protein